MPKRQAKATKKFERTQLKGVLQRRKEFSKVKVRHQKKEQRQKKAARNAEGDGSASEKSDGDVDMNDDQFFEPELDILENGKKANGKKRKRSDVEEKVDDGFAGFSIEGSDDEANSAPSESGDHRGQLDALAQKDPTFFKYLQENDAELLEFDDAGDLAEVDALSEDEPSAPKSKDSKTDVVITGEMIERWKTSMTERHSVRALRQLVLAFRAAAHINDDERHQSKYSIPDPDVYHRVVVTALRQIPSVLNHHIPVKETTGGKLRITTDSSKFKTLAPLIKSHASSVHHLLTHLTDAPTLKMTLQTIDGLLPYLLQFRNILKTVIKSVVAIWSDPPSAETVRVAAFMILRRLMVLSDAGVRETLLKASYEGIVRGSRNTTVHTLAAINLMKNSAAQIWGLDGNVGYTAAYTQIRQLAIHLRGTITKPTKESYKAIYNWQFVHSLDFWSRVLALHCTEASSPLHPLIYPVVQLTLGTITLIPTPTYFPLHIHLIRSLLRISSSTRTYIPLSPPLLTILTSSFLSKPALPSTLPPLSLPTTLRCPATHLRTRPYQTLIGTTAISLVADSLAIWSASIAFPELILPLTIALKRWLRTASSATAGNKNPRVNGALAVLVQKIEANAVWVRGKRDPVDFAPGDRGGVERFERELRGEEGEGRGVLMAYVRGERERREREEKVLSEGRKEDEKSERAERGEKEKVGNGKKGKKGKGRAEREDAEMVDVEADADE